MRWYSHPTYKFHMQEMKKFKDEDAIKAQFI